MYTNFTWVVHVYVMLMFALGCTSPLRIVPIPEISVLSSATIKIQTHEYKREPKRQISDDNP